MRRSAAAIVLAVVAGPLAGPGGAAAQDTAFGDRAYVDSVATARIGPGFACAVVTAPEGDPHRRLLIMVTDAAAVPAAQQLGGELTHAGIVEVRVVADRFHRARIEAIRARATATFPDDAQGIGVGERTVYMDHCPRVNLVLLPRRAASARSQRWARRLIERYGSDRVYVSRGRAWPR